MSNQGRGDEIVPADAPTSYDYVLAALPAPVATGIVAGYVSSVSLTAGLAAGSVVAAVVVAHALFVDPPTG